MSVKKQDGFREQRLLVLPDYIQKELGEQSLTKSLYVSDIGFFPHAEFHYRERPEGCDAAIFIYCVEGEGWIEWESERTIRLGPRSLAVIPAGTPHRYFASESNPWSIYWFHLKGDDAGGLIALYGLSDEPLELPLGTLTSFIDGVEQSFAILSDKPYAMPAHVHVAQTMRHLISEIGFGIGRSAQNRKREQHLEAAIRYMTEHLATAIRLPELARHTGLSKQHLIHLFNRETGFSPIDYFLRMKMQRAAQMLDLTDLSVKEIASSVGIADPYYFSRLFKKVMGHSPTVYRNIPKG
ncbi:AraC family transcriptional regulator [Paenibacillus arenilitoris]|uniref:AraC family transcriptional regulator n=1 Tax=Paenibacillus arenilitoris TaxID=2772299 RepID=A0A927H3T4_9BACL|nr:AraC family transcriptional regulator [Paenibacillus arenilitoris]MBD2867200.1 AraC family transcriptional regulator [Paenibacillus arenilitoris]